MEGKNICGVWHRRAGKDEVLLNAIGVKAIQRPASYAYMFPEISHARRSMWNAVNPHTGKRRILETFPEEIVSSINETDMRIDLVTGSNILFFGSDQYDRIVGAGLAGVVSSEHALAHPAAYAYFSPMLRENNGFFWAISTPRGRNHFKDLRDYADKSPRWFTETLSIHDTGALSAEEIAEAREEYIGLWGIDAGTAYFQQEYEVSFNAAILGAFYAGEMLAVRNEGRITEECQAIPGRPVHRAWDIGVLDDTSVWWFQAIGGQIFILDCYSNSGGGIDHYADYVKQTCAERGWVSGIDYVPHDATNRQWVLPGARSIIQQMGAYGLNPEQVPDATKLNGIAAARQTLARCVFHPRCEQGISALEQYRRKWDDEKKTFMATEVHDWSSHLADAFRYLSLAWRAAPREMEGPSLPEPKPGQVRPPPVPVRKSGNIRL